MKYIKSYTTKLLAFLLILCVFCACKKKEDNVVSNNVEVQTETHSHLSENTLTIPMISNPVSFHPLYIQESQLRNIYNIIFESLLNFNDEFEPVSGLAQKWSFNENSNSWIFEIRPNIHWHGNLGEVSASDAAYTINKVLSDPNSIYYSSIEPFVSSASGDGNTLTVNTKNSSYAFLYSLCALPIIPQEYYENKSENTSDIPYGSGCFNVDSLTNTSIDLSINQKWWKKLPSIQNIVVKGYNNSDEIFKAFANKEIDCFSSSRLTTEIYEILSDVSFQEYLSHYYVFLGLNNSGILGNISFRQAIAYSLDRNDLINNVYLSKASGTEQPLFPDYSISNASIKQYDKNLSQSKNLLKSLGFEDIDSDGFLELNGEKFSFNISFTENVENPIRLEAANNIKNQLKKVGLNTNIDSCTEAQLQEKISSGNYQLALTGYYLSDFINVSYMFKGAGNITNYYSEKMNNYISNYYSASSKEAFSKACLDIQNQFYNDLPHIGLLFQMETFLYNSSLVPTQIKRENFIYKNISEWTITP